MASLKFKKGDVFYFQISNTKFAIGIVLNDGKYENLYGIFNVLYDGLPEPSKILFDVKKAKLIITAKTDNLFFKLKRWIKIGNTPIDYNACTEFKIERPEGTFVCDENLNILRKATLEEIIKLKYVSSVSPATIVTATKMFYGFEPMNESYREYFVKI
jgi:hypothetical protein